MTVKSVGQPGIDGVLAAIASPKPEYDSELFGRYTPVVEGNSAVIHEPNEVVVVETIGAELLNTRTLATLRE